MSDFEAEVKNSLRAINSQVAMLDLAVKKVQASATSMGRTVTGAFTSGAVAAAAAKKSAEAYQLTLKRGAALGQATGGVGGQLAGRFASGLGMGGGSMGMTLALTAAAGLMVRTLVGAAIRNMQTEMSRVERVADKHKQVSKAVDQAEKTKGSQGLSALSDLQTDMAVFSRGGKQGQQDVEAHMKARPWLGRQDISSAILRSFDEPDDEKRGNLRYAAARMADTGLFSMTQAMESLMSDPSMRSMVAGGDRKNIAFALNRMMGRPQTKENLSDASDILARSYGRDSDPFIKEGKKAKALLNEEHEVGRGRVISGDATAAAAERLAAAIDPLSSEIGELVKEMRSREALLSKQADIQDRTLRGLVTLFERSPLGSGMTARERAALERIENGQALGSAGPTGTAYGAD